MSSKQLSRRSFLRAAGLTAAAGTLAACAAQPAAPAPAAEQKPAAEATAAPEEAKPAPESGGAKKVVRHYAQGLTPRERLETDRWDPPKAMNDMKAQYEEAHPDVTIEFVPNLPSGYEEWLMTQMSGGTSPEIVWYQRGYIARDYEKGWFVNLDPYLAEKNPYDAAANSWKEAFQGPVIASGTAPDGHIYMITGDIVGTGFFYNKSRFDKLGLKMPTTWKEFIAVQQALKDDGTFPMSISYELTGGTPLYGSWSTRIIQDVMYDKKMSMLKCTTDPVAHTWKPGENLPPQVMVNAIKDGRYSPRDAEWGEMLKILKDWSVYYPEGFTALPPDQVYTLWATDKAAIAWMGSWQNKPVRNDPLIEFEWGIFDKIPTLTEETSQFGGSLFPAMAGVGGVFQYAIASEAEKRGVLNETVDWMRFITAPKQLIALLNDHGGFAPGTVDTTGADPTLAVYTKMLVDAGAERIEPFDSMLTREFVDSLWNQLQQFMAGQLEQGAMQEQVAQEMEAAADELLAEHADWKKECTL
jgi:ABC-type glycerol-3-phosphate transport system substrate-binding protein